MIMLLLVVGILVGSLGTLWLLDNAPVSEREEALLAELNGLRAAQRLSLRAWQTRQYMQNLDDPPDGVASQR